MSVEDRLRALPSVDRLAAEIDAATPREAVAAARAAIAERREELLAGAGGDVDLAARARAHAKPTLRRVLNGTGVVVHTNLGRVPLAPAAVAAVTEAAHGYASLEMEMDSGRRGARERHVRGLLSELTGAQDALVVNNGAAAILLAVAALAGAGRRVAVSRGQLVEIGGGFRVPDIIAQAGAELVEVGTTNRTRLDDYRRAVESDGAQALLRVHQSNFRTVGFVQEVEVERLCSLGPPVIDDVGSGALLDGRGPDRLAALADEPSVRRSVAAGTALVCFSGDKLLGGPQAGILVGRMDAVDACRRHPLARAVRIGRLPLAGLAATLALYRDPERALREIPALAMLAAEPEVLAQRAERLAAATGGTVVEATGRVGGGALPLLELSGPALALDPPGGDAGALAAALRGGEPPLVPRILDGRVLVDPRTLAEEEIDPAVAAIERALTS
jgi:L-seryl-tRNA(Ser) seleniumtransferase